MSKAYDLKNEVDEAIDVLLGDSVNDLPNERLAAIKFLEKTIYDAYGWSKFMDLHKYFGADATLLQVVDD